MKVKIKKIMRKMTKPELQKLIKNGVKEIDSKAGFTQPAIEYRDKHQKQVKLFSKGKKSPPLSQVFDL